jgi:hypothetical protein
VSVALPFRFDTSPVVVSIMRGVLGLLLIVAIGAAYAVAVSRRPEVILGLIIIGLIVIYFGRLFLANLTGSRGTITVEAVTVEPVRICGLRLAGPEGTFPINRFRAVRVERVSPPTEGYGGPHARVYLAGGDGTPDIFVARSPSPDEGRALGRGLASALGLPVEEPPVPY